MAAGKVLALRRKLSESVVVIFMSLISVGLFGRNSMANGSCSASMQRQRIDAFFALDLIEAHHRCFARKLDRGDDGVELGAVEIALELLAGLPFLHEQKGLALVDLGVETGLHAACGRPGRTQQRTQRAQNCRSL